MTNNFLEWVSGAKIYIGYSNCGLLGGHGFVAASSYEENDVLGDAVENLNGRWDSASEGEQAILGLKWCLHANDPDPVVAMAKLMDKMREYHRTISIEQEIAAHDRDEPGPR